MDDATETMPRAEAPRAEADLAELRALVAEMGGMAETAIDGAITALVNRDADGAARVVEADRRLDALEAQLERRVVAMLAVRGQDEAELRTILAALKIGGVVERIGDYAKNIAKRVPLLIEARGLQPMSVLPAMARAAADMVRDALDSFAARDPATAIRVCHSDRIVDDFYNSLFRTLLTYMLENPHNIGACTHLLFIGKHLERIGDQATNLAEMVYFAATGEQMAERARGRDALEFDAASLHRDRTSRAGEWAGAASTSVDHEETRGEPR